MNYFKTNACTKKTLKNKNIFADQLLHFCPPRAFASLNLATDFFLYIRKLLLKVNTGGSLRLKIAFCIISGQKFEKKIFFLSNSLSDKKECRQYEIFFNKMRHIVSKFSDQ